jgi:hypothetical protein
MQVKFLACMDIPRINFPKESDDYKVVQLMIENEPYLRFAFQPRSAEFHSDILARLARQIRKEYPTMQVRRGGMHINIPAPESDWYSLVGAGWARIDVNSRMVLFGSSSMDYEVSIHSEHLVALKQYAQDWTLTENVFIPNY